MINKWLCILIAVICAIGMIILPKECITSASQGLMLCFNVIIPSLFPFIICAKIIIKSGLAKSMGRIFEPVMRPLFNVPGCGSFPFIIGILSGYPLGAKCAIDLYENNCCSKAEAERLICFCNNSGPLFIMGSVGIGILGSKSAGVCLYIAHILSALTVGIIFSFYKRTEKCDFKNRKVKSKETKTDLFPSSVKESVDLILYVCGFVIFFSVLLKILSTFITIKSPILKGLLYGFFEMVNGINNINLISDTSLKLILISAVTAWGGVSVIMQVSGVIGNTDISKKVFIFAKIIQAFFASVYTFILLNLSIGKIQVFSDKTLSLPVSPFFYSLFLLSLLVVLVFFLSVFCQLVKFVNKL